MLFVFLVQSAAGTVDAALFGPDGAVLAPLVGLVTLLPWLAAGWRRMHDSGRSGLHLIYPLIVMVGIGTFGAFAMGIPEGTVQDASMIVLVFAGIVFMISPLLVLWWLTRPSDPELNQIRTPTRRGDLNDRAIAERHLSRVVLPAGAERALHRAASRTPRRRSFFGR